MRVAIIHPWFPQYRYEFFETLSRKAETQGLHIDIFYGAAPPELATRGDSVAADFAHELPTKYIKLGKKSAGFKSIRAIESADRYDVIVMEQAVRNLETYWVMARRMASRIAFWGHGRTYTKPVGPVQERLKEQLTTRGDWFFAYTKGGATAVSKLGFNDDAITVVNNSIDTRALQSHIASVTSDDVDLFRDRLGASGPIALFLGGLDSSKRLDFLLESSQRVARKLPRFKLVIAGRGDGEGLVQSAASRYAHVEYVGGLFGKDKAIAMEAADLMSMPGRVGLVAVDSFAASLPIVTTDWRWHAPEYEYLTNGRNAIVSENTVEAYAQAITHALEDHGERARLAEGCLRSAETYTVEAMVDRFLEGLHGMKAMYSLS